MFSIGSIYVLKGRGELCWAVTWLAPKTGSNDARHIVWGLGICFFLFFYVFFFFIDVILVVGHPVYHVRIPEIGPKRLQTTR
jgi:hypothetical protein